jgi:hypothetical protein
MLRLSTGEEAGQALYANCGDWVDSCSAIVEHFDGRLELIIWDGDQAPSTGDELAVAALAGQAATGETAP